MSVGRRMPPAFIRSAHLRPHAGGTEPAGNPAFLGDAHLLEHEDVLHGDDVAFHAGDLRDRRHLARAVGQARLLHDELNGRRNLLPHGFLRQVGRAHRDHRLDTGQRVARRVGVHGGQRSVVTGVHRLQHVEGFLAADLADHDAIRPHTQGVDHELTLLDGALAFDVGRTGLETHDVLLVHLQFGRVLDRDDALLRRDEAGEHVEERRLTGAGAAADQTVQPRLDAAGRGSRASAASSRRAPRGRRP